jgi:ribosomal protein S16
MKEFSACVDEVATASIRRDEAMMKEWCLYQAPKAIRKKARRLQLMRRTGNDWLDYGAKLSVLIKELGFELRYYRDDRGRRALVKEWRT